MRNLSHPKFFYHLPHFLQWPVPPKSISQPSLICLFLASWLPLLWIPIICHLYHCSIFLTGAPGPIATSLKRSLEPKESFYDGKLIVFLLCSYVISDSQGLIAVVFKFNVQGSLCMFWSKGEGQWAECTTRQGETLQSGQLCFVCIILGNWRHSPLEWKFWSQKKKIECHWFWSSQQTLTSSLFITNRRISLISRVWKLHRACIQELWPFQMCVVGCQGPDQTEGSHSLTWLLVIVLRPFLLCLRCLVPVMDVNIELCLKNTQGLHAGTIPRQSQILNYTLSHNLHFSPWHYLSYASKWLKSLFKTCRRAHWIKACSMFTFSELGEP